PQSAPFENYDAILLLTIVGDLQHLCFFAVHSGAVHFEMVLVIGHLVHDAAIVRFFTRHDVDAFVRPVNCLAAIGGRAGSGHDAGAHIVHPGGDVLLEQVVVTIGTLSMKGHAVIGSFGIFTKVTTIHDRRVG